MTAPSRYGMTMNRRNCSKSAKYEHQSQQSLKLKHKQNHRFTSLSHYEPCTHSTDSHLHSLLVYRFHDQAIRHLNSHPTESRIWILQEIDNNNHNNSSCEYNLPLHYVCSATNINDGDISLPLLQTLIQQYPNASQHYNSRGHLPLHLACQCVSFTHRPSLAESAIMILIKAHPHGLLCENKEGWRPIDLLLENGVDCKRGKRGGNVLRFIRSKMMEMQNEGDNHLRHDVHFSLEDLQREDARGDVESCDVNNYVLDDLQTTRYFHDNVNESRDDDNVLEDYYPIERRDNTQKSSQFQRAFDTAISGSYNNNRELSEKMDDNYFLDQQIEMLSDDTPRHANRKKSKPKHFSDDIIGTQTINEYPHHKENELNNPFNSKQQQKRTSLPSSLPLNVNPPMNNSSQEYCYNHPPVITPANNKMSTPKSIEHDKTPPPTNNIYNPFRHLEEELHAMKASHDSMSNLLNTKATNELNLQSQLSQLQDSYAKLDVKYNTLSSKYSKVMEQSKDMDRLLADKNHELQVMKTKEDAISFELTARLRTNEEQQCKLNQLADRLKEEERNRVSIERDLVEERKVNSKLMEMNEEMAQSNNDLVKQLEDAAKEKQSLLQDVAMLKEEAAAKDKLLADSATKETSMCNQLMQKLSLLDSSENESQEKDDRLKKEQEKNSMLERELLAAQKKATANAKLVKAMEKKSMEAQSLIEDEQSKNIQLEKELAVMREKVEAAKVGLAYLQHRKATPKDNQTADNSIIMNDDKEGQQKDNVQSALSSKESLNLLSPLIQDVLKSQTNTVQHARMLVQEAAASKHLIGQLFEISSRNFSFQSTLQILESIMTAHIKTIKELDAAVGFERSCQTKLSSLLDFPLDAADLEDVLDDIPTIKSLPQQQHKKLAAATRNHVKKIESIHKMALDLQRIKVDGTYNNNDKKHILVANEMTSIFQQTMATLLQDANQMIDSDTDTNIK